jgi:hypothetical protein
MIKHHQVLETSVKLSAEKILEMPIVKDVDFIPENLREAEGGYRAIGYNNPRYFKHFTHQEWP